MIVSDPGGKTHSVCKTILETNCVYKCPYVSSGKNGFIVYIAWKSNIIKFGLPGYRQGKWKLLIDPIVLVDI